MAEHEEIRPRPVLRGTRVTLRPPRPTDKQDRLASGRHPELVRMYGGDCRRIVPLDADAVERWYAGLCADPLRWVIDVDGRCTGTARLHQLDEQNRRARYAVGIDSPDDWGQGIGTDATKLVLKFAFEELHLHRVELRVLDYNERAIRCYEKCGFVREGVEREGALVADEFHSDIIMGILEDEYREIAKTW